MRTIRVRCISAHRLSVSLVTVVASKDPLVGGRLGCERWGERGREGGTVLHRPLHPALADGFVVPVWGHSVHPGREPRPRSSSALHTRRWLWLLPRGGRWLGRCHLDPPPPPTRGATAVSSRHLPLRSERPRSGQRPMKGCCSGWADAQLGADAWAGYRQRAPGTSRLAGCSQTRPGQRQSSIMNRCEPNLSQGGCRERSL